MSVSVCVCKSRLHCLAISRHCVPVHVNDGRPKIMANTMINNHHNNNDNNKMVKLTRTKSYTLTESRRTEHWYRHTHNISTAQIYYHNVDVILRYAKRKIQIFRNLIKKKKKKWRRWKLPEEKRVNGRQLVWVVTMTTFRTRDERIIIINSVASSGRSSRSRVETTRGHGAK